MFSEKFRLTQPILTQFFEAALSGTSKMHHSYMFTGSDEMAQYFAAMQIAKILNCQNGISHTGNCTCTNCLWINRNSHPAVITISPIDYTYGNKDSKSSTVISVNQARYLKEALSTSSQYYRVIIFTDAVEDKSYEKKAERFRKEYENLLVPPVSTENSSDNERPFWLPMPIKQETFNPATLNSLLKTIEEPEERVLFFFLTKDKEDIIETIVSRCQILPVKSIKQSNINFDVFNQISEFFPPRDYSQAFFISEKLIEISKQEYLSTEDILDFLQEYFKTLLESNANNRVFSLRFMDYIKKIENAKTQLNHYITPQIVLESLLLGLV
ncbi:MAG: hypothetical protein PHC34_05100 [Candidatus Gastranaerophilales bacterium]|nr:hypothetical protein [Candidatus Gastranaerophilales bacterium]